MRENTQEEVGYGTAEIVQTGSNNILLITITSEQMTVEEGFESVGMSFPHDKQVLCGGHVVQHNAYIDKGDQFQVVAEKVQAGK